MDKDYIPDVRDLSNALHSGWIAVTFGKPNFFAK